MEKRLLSLCAALQVTHMMTVLHTGNMPHIVLKFPLGTDTPSDTPSTAYSVHSHQNYPEHRGWIRADTWVWCPFSHGRSTVWEFALGKTEQTWNYRCVLDVFWNVYLYPFLFCLTWKVLRRRLGWKWLTQKHLSWKQLQSNHKEHSSCLLLCKRQGEK